MSTVFKISVIRVICVLLRIILQQYWHLGKTTEEHLPAFEIPPFHSATDFFRTKEKSARLNFNRKTQKIVS